MRTLEDFMRMSLIQLLHLKKTVNDTATLQIINKAIETILNPDDMKPQSMKSRDNPNRKRYEK
jgi:hypothetical protein